MRLRIPGKGSQRICVCDMRPPPRTGMCTFIIQMCWVFIFLGEIMALYDWSHSSRYIRIRLYSNLHRLGIENDSLNSQKRIGMHSGFLGWGEKKKIVFGYATFMQEPKQKPNRVGAADDFHTECKILIAKMDNANMHSVQKYVVGIRVFDKPCQFISRALSIK